MTSIGKSNSVSITSTAAPGSAPTNSFAVYTPDTTIDSWTCATKNISDYLKPPMPTAHMLDVFYDHSDKIYAECEANIPKPFTTYPACPSVAKASWCAVTVPSSDSADYRAYVSSAASWWSTHSSRLSDLQEECPNTWNDAKKEVLGGEIWLNATIAIAECFDGDNPVVSSVKPSTKPHVVATSSASRAARRWWK
ncbi:hypothetical protein J1614_010808 [Plenodomus biglobosus]|nr:hypothetical protein J1614_010808 [Plenodomus biglobosus]